MYSVALHRLLRHRLGSDYDYDQHFGGVYYLFLRGMELVSSGSDEKQRSAQNSKGRDVLPGVYFIKPEKDLIQRMDELLEGSINE